MSCLPSRLSVRGFVSLLCLFAAMAFTSSHGWAASATLSWQDNSSNEDGFKIERGQTTSYAQIASVGANTVAYTDSGLVEGSTYCYRVRAFNSSGDSSPSNESCITIPLTLYSLNLTKSGTSSGSVTSSPAGISCGTDCSEAYPSGTVVALTATPTSGSTFAGWSGDSDCVDGVVTMGANKTCTATFNSSIVSNYVLSVSISSVVSSEGSGNGSVTSSPAGINCGSDCSESYSSGTVVSLTPVPASGSIFSGWSGDSDCSDGLVTMSASKSCTAAFKLDTATLNLVRSGDGTVTSSPSGIYCGNDCTKSYAKGTKVTLSAKPNSNGKFLGWSGGGCQGVSDCSIDLMDSTSVTAVFVNPEPSAIGIFRPASGDWLLDKNGNGQWDGCGIDLCLGPFGSTGDIPVVGDWAGTGLSHIGVFRPSTDEWFLDLNGNGQWDGCSVDRCLNSSRPQETLPVIGDWTGSGVDMIGEMLLGKGPKWYLDLNGDGVIDSCKTDSCPKFPSSSGDLPVAGMWNGSGKSDIGVFRQSTGEWFLDYSDNGQWDNCQVDRCFTFGSSGDQPVVGDWTGSGASKIGVFRPASGQWFLDLTGNGQWDGCSTDGCIQFDHQEGDLPVVGKWQ